MKELFMDLYSWNDFFNTIGLGFVLGFILVFSLVLFNLLIPTKWVFKYRYWFYGLVFAFTFSLITPFKDLLSTEFYSITNSLLVWIFSLFIIVLFMGIFLNWRYRKLVQKTKFELEADEVEILSDSATFDNEDTTKKGRLILTTKRLCFVSDDKENSRFVFNLNDLSSKIEINKQGWYPSGILLPEKETKILLMFPYLWKREIERLTMNNLQ